jgi:anti-sigma B factor antagonist
MSGEAAGSASLSSAARVATVALHGEIDLATVGQVDQCVNEALADPRTEQLVLDLAACTYMDSSGLHALVRTNRRCEELGRRLTIRGATGIVRRVIDLSSLDAELPLEAP